MITIDGSYGEGGGQILRTSASLAAITGQPVRIERIRAGRTQGGLKAQHLTAIEAAMRVCNGRLEGGLLGATEVVMTPGSPVQAGRYEFGVGTAGSAPLVLQTLLLPLLVAGDESRVEVGGGTHNTHAPSSDYLRHTFLGASRAPVEVTVERVGFFPRGGGRIVAGFQPVPFGSIQLTERGQPSELRGIVTVSDALPTHILERAQAEIERRGKAAGWPFHVELHPVATFSPSMAVHLEAVYEGGRGGFTGLGRKGVPTERIVEEAWNELEAFHQTGATVDEHLADQLVLPALFADAPSEYVASRITDHLRTMAWLVPQFGVGRVEIDETTRRVRVLPARSA